MSFNKTAHAHQIRQFVIVTLGGCCSKCPVTHSLHCDLIESDGGAHHSLSHSERQMFYLSQMLAGNLQLLCTRCHTLKTLRDIQSRRVARLNSAGSVSQT
jgi:5-methylcytosine-specific restriction endonuclease McrA